MIAPSWMAGYFSFGLAEGGVYWEMTQHNAGLAEETNAAIEQTGNQANQFDSIVEIFVLEKGGWRPR